MNNEVLEYEIESLKKSHTELKSDIQCLRKDLAVISEKLTKEVISTSVVNRVIAVLYGAFSGFIGYIIAHIGRH